MVGKILMFDSGIGGISVYREIKQLMPELAIDYLFDNLYYPYGELSEQQLIDRLSGLISHVVQKSKPDLLVIACNSASTIALPSLRKLLDIPVVGVVPAIKPAADITNNNIIALLATKGTIDREYIDDLGNEHAPHCQIIKVGSNELVSMAEQAFRGITPDLNLLGKICHPFTNKADTLVLGCTHFPLLSDYLSKVCTGEIRLVDSGKAIAKRVQQLLANKATLTVKSEDKKKPDMISRALYTQDNLDDLLVASLYKEGFSSLSLVIQPLD